MGIYDELSPTHETEMRDRLKRAEPSVRSNPLEKIQGRVATKLARTVLDAHPSQRSLSVLEIGCGEGHLSTLLFPHFDTYILSDISWAHVVESRRILNAPYGVVVDGEAPCFTAAFDIIVSSFTFHWFRDPKGALTQLIGCLKPGGTLYLTALGCHSFHEWHTAHAVNNAPCPLPDFIPHGALKSWLPLTGNREIREEWYGQSVEDPQTYLQDLMMQPLPPVPDQVQSTYRESARLSSQILYLTYHKPSQMIREE